MFRRLMVVTLILALAGSATSWAVQAKALNAPDLTPAVQQQIAELIAEKNARTPTEQKVDSNLLYAFKQQTGKDLTAPVAALQTGVTVDARQMTVVDITTQVTPDVLKRLEASGAQVVSSYPQYRSIRANVPIDQVLTIAGWSEVIFIQPKQAAQLADTMDSRASVDNRSADVLALISPQLRSTMRPDFSARAQRVQAQLRATLAASPISSSTQASVQPAVTQGLVQTNPINRSEGDIAHQADRARQTYGYIGSGVKVCVLSDGVDSLASLQASGDLPAVTVVPG